MILHVSCLKQSKNYLDTTILKINEINIFKVWLTNNQLNSFLTRDITISINPKAKSMSNYIESRVDSSSAKVEDFYEETIWEKVLEI